MNRPARFNKCHFCRRRIDILQDDYFRGVITDQKSKVVLLFFTCVPCTYEQFLKKKKGKGKG